MVLLTFFVTTLVMIVADNFLRDNKPCRQHSAVADIQVPYYIIVKPTHLTLCRFAHKITSDGN